MDRARTFHPGCVVRWIERHLLRMVERGRTRAMAGVPSGAVGFWLIGTCRTLFGCVPLLCFLAVERGQARLKW